MTKDGEGNTKYLSQGRWVKIGVDNFEAMSPSEKDNYYIAVKGQASGRTPHYFPNFGDRLDGNSQIRKLMHQHAQHRT